MILFPPAKINLGLNVINKRSDGFHELETVMYPIQLFDILEIHKSDSFEWKQSGLLIDGKTEDNLCFKAFQLVQNEFNIGNVYMHLRKQIPFGAGLGGGSSDAAYVIKGLNELFDLKISLNRQKELAGILGSDCPFFIENKTQIATGRGEILENIELDLSNYHLLIIKPSIHINTATAYSGVTISGISGKLSNQLQEPIQNWKSLIKNDFEPHIFKLHPQLQQIKDQLYKNGALYASMSGSGSAMYGFFTNKVEEIQLEGCELFWCK